MYLDDFVSSIAIGAGCCSDLLNNTQADLIISGEFLHHEILHETHRNVSVILTDHSNTERGYNQVFKQRFLNYLKTTDNDTVEIIISKSDRDPLEYV
jgi:putative NIF3 family GTP cyclohydrolase 1 type 2